MTPEAANESPDLRPGLSCTDAAIIFVGIYPDLGQGEH